MRTLVHPSRGDIALSAVLHALSDPLRLQIVRHLVPRDEESCAFGVPVTRSTLSHHLRVLREAGLTQTRITGTQRFVSVRRDDLEARFPGLLAAIVLASAPL